MTDELVQEYLRRYNKAFSLLKNEETASVWTIELLEDELRKSQQDFANRLFHDMKKDIEVFSYGAIIFYGYRLGALKLKGKNECFTRQDGYKDNAIWNYNLDEVLNEETDEDNPCSGISHLIKWIINPGSNTDVSEAVLDKMINPIIKNMCKIIPPGKRSECTIVLPPISMDIEFCDWPSLFIGLKARNIKINIVNYGHLLDLSEDERKYVYIHQSDGINEYVIIAAYELIRGHNTCLGCMAFDVDDADHQYILHDVKNVSLNIDNEHERYEKKEKIEVANEWNYIKCKYPINNGFNSFLGNHAVSFIRELYKVNGIKDDAHYNTEIVKAVFRENEALQVFEVCSRMLQEQNLYNISLGDMVYVANILQRDKGFTNVTMSTTKNYQLGTYNRFASMVDINKLEEIPANYATFTWRTKDKRKTIVPYFHLDIKKHSEKQIIESILEHFEHCTTGVIADELLYLYKDGSDPSAFFAAKVFLQLSQMESLEIESRNENVQSIDNVDAVEYVEIDKSHIKVATPIKTNYPKTSAIIKKEDKKSIQIEEMNFTVRTYNCLRRAGCKNTSDLTKRTRAELMKVRNLGRSGQEEIVLKLSEYGLKLAGE